MIRDLVAARMGIDKMRVWMRTPNPALRGFTPDHYFLVGKEEELLRIIWHMMGYPAHGD